MSIISNESDKLKNENEAVMSEKQVVEQILQKESVTDLKQSEESLEEDFYDFEEDDDDHEEDEEDEHSYYGQFSKSWDELTFSDNFLFCKIMEDEDICRQLLEILLPIKIGKIRYLSTKKEFHPTYKGRSIRLDVFRKQPHT